MYLTETIKTTITKSENQLMNSTVKNLKKRHIQSCSLVTGPSYDLITVLENKPVYNRLIQDVTHGKYVVQTVQLNT